MSDIVAIPSPDSDYTEVALSGQADGVRTLRKKILPMNGSFIHPADHSTKIYVDSKMAQSLVDNFKRGVCEIVQVPIVNKDNQHTEDPRDNAGRVKGLDYDSTGVYATIEASKYAEDFGKTILGASAFLHLNYIDTATGERVGPTLLHVAATNRPHINGLGDWEDMLKASADTSNEEEVLFLRDEAATPVEPKSKEDTPRNEKEQNPMTKEEWLAAGKEYGFDVEALQANVTETATALEAKETEAAQLSAQLDEAKNQIKLSGEALSDTENIASAIVELSNSNKALVSDIETLKLANANYAKRDAEHEVDEKVRKGFILPAQRDVMVQLSMTDHTTYEALLPAQPLVALSESGATLHEEPNRPDYKADVERYKALLAKSNSRV